MASVVKEPFNHHDWIFETKLDVFRAIAVIDSTGPGTDCRTTRWSVVLLSAQMAAEGRLGP
jgi:hypothetical protein